MDAPHPRTSPRRWIQANSGWHSGTWLNASGEFVGWDNLDEIDRFAFEHSDIIGFHGYSGIRTFRAVTEVLSGLFDRPVIATEYMARPYNTFERMLPILKEHGVGAINWGLVSGKSQTIYPWSTWTTPNPGEPDPWFHDVLKPNCAPYDPDEAALIRQLTGTTSGNQLPAFDDGASASRSMAENPAKVKGVGAAVSARDADGGTLVYTLEGADADSFGVVGTSGQLTTKAGVAYDYEAKSSYSVRIRVEDGQCGAATIDVAVNLTGVNDRAQMAAFLSRLYTAITGEIAPVVEHPFTDIADSFARDDIARIYGLGITAGRTATNYDPGADVTRAQMAAFLSRLYTAITGEIAPVVEHPFTDIADSFARDDIARIYGLGITAGRTATNYDPGAVVTRAQMAAFRSRLYTAVGASPR